MVLVKTSFQEVLDRSDKGVPMNYRRGHEIIQVSVGLLAQLVRYLKHFEVDVNRLSSLGLNPQILDSPDDRISIDTYMV